jgi:hypothetical protein
MESHRNWIQFASAAKNVAVPRRGKCPLIDIQQGRITSKDRFKGQNVADFFMQDSIFLVILLSGAHILAATNTITALSPPELAFQMTKTIQISDDKYHSDFR